MRRKYVIEMYDAVKALIDRINADPVGRGRCKELTRLEKIMAKLEKKKGLGNWID